MKTQRFVAPTVKEALQKVKDELGDDAIIISNRRIKNSKIEIVARPDSEAGQEIFETNASEHIGNSQNTLDLNSVREQVKQPPVLFPKGSSQDVKGTKKGLDLSAQEMNHLIASFTSNKDVDTNRLTSLKKLKDDRSIAQANNLLPNRQLNNDEVSDKNTERLFSELDDLKKMLSQHFSTENIRSAQLDMDLRSVHQLLQSLGFDETLVKPWSKKITEDLAISGIRDLGQDRKWIKPIFSKLLPIINRTLPILKNEVIHESGIYAFVGPTGAGKTTSIAKIAARYVLTHGHESIGLISTDTHRIGAQEQVQVLARELNIDAQCVGLDQSVIGALEAFKDKKMILIDTAGFTFRNTQRHKQLLSLATLCPEIKTILVLPATHELSVQDKLKDALSSLNIFAAMITKCDEGMTLGQSLSLMIKHKIPLAYVCDGQTIPDDIHYLKPKALIGFIARLYVESMGIVLASRLQKSEFA